MILDRHGNPIITPSDIPPDMEAIIGQLQPSFAALTQREQVDSLLPFVLPVLNAPEAATRDHFHNLTDVALLLHYLMRLVEARNLKENVTHAQLLTGSVSADSTIPMLYIMEHTTTTGIYPVNAPEGFHQGQLRRAFVDRYGEMANPALIHRFAKRIDKARLLHRFGKREFDNLCSLHPAIICDHISEGRFK